MSILGWRYIKRLPVTNMLVLCTVLDPDAQPITMALTREYLAQLNNV